MIPDNADIGLVNHVIFDELCLGIINDDSRKQYIRIIEQMKSNGAEGVILGCTEIGLLIQQKDTSLPVFDTTVIHARTAALKALEQ
jgi:aspartate racemase